MKRILVLCLLTAALSAASCGGGGGNDEPTPARFVYTPVPYTVVIIPPIRGTPQPNVVVAVEESGQRYIADEVVIQLGKSARIAFERWATSLGFTMESSSVTDDSNRFDYTRVVVKVPPGSALDAVELIRVQPGVRTASVNSLARTDI